MTMVEVCPFPGVQKRVVDKLALSWSIPMGAWQQLEEANAVFRQMGVIIGWQRSTRTRGCDGALGRHGWHASFSKVISVFVFLKWFKDIVMKRRNASLPKSRQAEMTLVKSE
jgi:hypothetical protein